MPPIINPLMNLGIGSELIYSFIIILTSLIIYFKTKELYELSSYKGINYFRKAFLFFAAAYFFRVFIKFILVYSEIDEIFYLSPQFAGLLTLFVFLYLSTMAMFYLIYSITWKNQKIKLIYFHIISLVIPLLLIFLRQPLIYLGMNLLLLILGVSLIYAAHNNIKKQGKNNGLYVIYSLLFSFWTLNIIDILIPRFLQNTQLIIYLLSLGIFITILYKVISKTGSN